MIVKRFAVLTKLSKIRRVLFVLIPGLLLLTFPFAISYRNKIEPKGIVIHHSAVPFALGAPIDAKVIDAIHQSRGFSIFCNWSFYHIGYHYVILPDGTLQQGRPESCRGAHTVGYNDYIGICLIGDFSPDDNAMGDKGPRQPTSRQLETLANLVRRLRSEYDLPVTNIYTHHELNTETKCPGENFQKELLIGRIIN
jgi:N-acetylmuramoyl-L-alanine amidase